mgnify:CR=1 FL=1
MNSVKAYIKSCTTVTVRRAVRDLATEALVYRRHWYAMRKVPRFLRSLPLKLNLGCGPNYKKGWVNIDLFSVASDLQLDLRRHWPFPDGSATHVYSEHAFEHFEFSEEVPHLLSESLRVLQGAGVLDIGVPDTEWAIHAYGNPEHDYWRHAPTWHPGECETQLDHINYHFRQGEQHKYAWDEETLSNLLHRSGFECISRRAFDATLDTESRRIGTLYIRAFKPSAVSSVVENKCAALR